MRQPQLKVILLEWNKGKRNQLRTHDHSFTKESGERSKSNKHSERATTLETGDAYTDTSPQLTSICSVIIQNYSCAGKINKCTASFWNSDHHRVPLSLCDCNLGAQMPGFYCHGLLSIHPLFSLQLQTYRNILAQTSSNWNKEQVYLLVHAYHSCTTGFLVENA